MTLMEIAALVTALLAVAGAIGGVVRWAAASKASAA